MASEEASKIPIIDLSAFTTDGDLQSRQFAAKVLAEKVHLNGSVGISGHGISSQVLKEAFELTRSLFDLSHDDKMKAPHPDSMTPHRGYSGIGREKGSAKTASETNDEREKNAYLNMTDYKESYEIGSDENNVQYNIWLPEEVFPGFRHFTTKFYWDLHKTASAILEALIMGLDLTEQETKIIRNLHTGHDNQLRLLHYPAISTEMLKDDSVGRVGAHRDWSTFTLLFQDDNGGLEFVDRETGEFLPATPKNGVLYLNIGDMFERISNGFYPSALHRVVVTGKPSGCETPSRYSIPYFIAPTPDKIIEPPPSLVARDGKQSYEAVTFNSYSEQMFKKTNMFE